MLREKVATGFEVRKRKGFNRIVMALIGILIVIYVDVAVVLPETMKVVQEANITGPAAVFITVLVPLGLGLLPVILIFRMLD